VRIVFGIEILDQPLTGEIIQAGLLVILIYQRKGWCFIADFYHRGSLIKFSFYRILSYILVKEQPKEL